MGINEKKGNTLAENLIENFEEKISKYFNEDKKSSTKWKNSYKNKIQNIEHDEPWLTLAAIFSIFGDQSDNNNRQKLEAINQVLANSGVRNPLQLDEILEIRLEEQFQEILEYRLDYI